MFLWWCSIVLPYKLGTKNYHLPQEILSTFNKVVMRWFIYLFLPFVNSSQWCAFIMADHWSPSHSDAKCQLRSSLPEIQLVLWASHSHKQKASLSICLDKINLASEVLSRDIHKLLPHASSTFVNSSFCLQLPMTSTAALTTKTLERLWVPEKSTCYFHVI